MGESLTITRASTIWIIDRVLLSIMKVQRHDVIEKN